jgi:hypothetical protein
LDLDGTFTQDAGAVVFNEAGADYDFRVEGSGEANALFVQGSDGNVGIGTASPGTNLEIFTDANAGGIMVRSDGNTYPDIILNSDRSSEGNYLGRIIAEWNDTGVAGIYFLAGDDTSNKDNAEMTFWTAEAGTPAVQMTINASGNVGIGTTTPSHDIHVVGTAGLSTGTAWTNTSDERIKTNIETIENGLDKINQLRPVSFNYSEDYLEQHPEINASKKYNSFIAQEYVDVFPDAVSVGGNLEKVTVEAVEAADGIEAVEEEKEILVEDMLQFTPHDLNMYLVKAIQELSAKVEALEG